MSRPVTWSWYCPDNDCVYFGPERENPEEARADGVSHAAERGHTTPEALEGAR